VLPIVHAHNISKRFAGVDALTDVSLAIRPGEVVCLLGDNGAGKSTLIKILSGVYPPSQGFLEIDGDVARCESPRGQLARGIATVHQTGGTVPLMSVARNFVLGAEPTKGRGPFRRFDTKRARQTALAEIQALGLQRVTNADRLVGSLSGGERQALAIARALYLGARVLILDEPTAALGVKEAGVVLRLVRRARDRGTGVLLVTHNVQHALSISDRFVVLIHGKVAATWDRGEKSREEVIGLMAGGQELEELELEIAEGAADGTDGASANDERTRSSQPKEP
jgi:simple sugar transport system ATP-binding protein